MSDFDSDTDGNLVIDEDYKDDEGEIVEIKNPENFVIQYLPTISETDVSWSPTSGLDMPDIYEVETGLLETDNVSIKVWSTCSASSILKVE